MTKKKAKRTHDLKKSPLDDHIEYLTTMADSMMEFWTMDGTSIEQDLILQQATLFIRLAANALRTYREKLD